MKTYELILLNKGLKLSRDKDLEQAQEVINRKVAEGWELQQLMSPADQCGAIIGVFWKEI